MHIANAIRPILILHVPEADGFFAKNLGISVTEAAIMK